MGATTKIVRLSALIRKQINSIIVGIVNSYGLFSEDKVISNQIINYLCYVSHLGASSNWKHITSLSSIKQIGVYAIYHGVYYYSSSYLIQPIYYVSHLGATNLEKITLSKSNNLDKRVYFYHDDIGSIHLQDYLYNSAKKYVSNLGAHNSNRSTKTLISKYGIYEIIGYRGEGSYYYGSLYLRISYYVSQAF